MDGLNGFNFSDSDNDDKDEKDKNNNVFVPTRREPWGYLSEGEPHSPNIQIRTKKYVSQLMYYYSIQDYGQAKSIALDFLDDPINVKTGKSLVNQFYDVLMKCSLEDGKLSDALAYCSKLIDQYGFQDSDPWMMKSIVCFLLGECDEGWRCLERCVAMRCGHPNYWLLYARLLSVQSSSPGSNALVSRLSNSDFLKRFSRYWKNVIVKLETDNESKLPSTENHRTFHLYSAVFNSCKLNSIVYEKHNSKNYNTDFLTYDAELRNDLQRILKRFPSSWQEVAFSNFSVIHIENWDEFNYDKLVFIEKFFAENPPL